MDNSQAVREFLMDRRGRIGPEEAGVPVYGRGTRRVPGLRREEVALLAGVSVDYYTRIERGDLNGVSAGVLAAIARALRFDDAEREHLFDLARAANGDIPPSRRRSPREVAPAVQWLLDRMDGSPAFVRNGCLDVLAINPLGRALYSPAFEDRDRPEPVNLARFCYLHAAAHELYPDCAGAADVTVALLRTEAGRDPHDRRLHDLIEELTATSEAFRTRWDAHEVRLHQTGTKTFTHPVVGDLELSFEAMELASHPGLTLTAYTVEPGSPSQDRLDLLASWSATSVRGAGGTRDSRAG